MDLVSRSWFAPDIGRMILEAIHDEGRHDFSTEVLNCAGDKELQFVAHIYVHHFLRLCASKLFLANLFLTIEHASSQMCRNRE